MTYKFSARMFVDSRAVRGASTCFVYLKGPDEESWVLHGQLQTASSGPTPVLIGLRREEGRGRRGAVFTRNMQRHKRTAFRLS